MKALSILAALSVSLGTSVFADKEASVSGVSPSRAISWSVNPYNGELSLVRADGSCSPVRLCDTVSTANLAVHFSPDDKYVFVSDGTASLGIHGTLYRRGSGLAYSEVDFDFDLPVQRLALQAGTGREITGTVLDHSYLKCLGWSRDGQWVLLQLSGSGKLNGKRVEIAGFKCAYNPAKGDLTNDGRLWR